MERRAVKRSFGWFIVLVLPLVLVLGVQPCAAEQTYTLQELLVDGATIDDIDNLEFSHFSVQSSSEIDPSNISVTTTGERTLEPGLEFVLNGELSVSGSGRFLIISYTVTHLGGDLIEGHSLNLGELTTNGNDSMVIVREETTYGQIDTITRTVFYELKENQSRQFSEGKLKTPRAVLRPTVKLQVKGADSSLDSFVQEFSLAPMIDAGEDQVVFDQVTLKPSGTPIGGECLWELYPKNEDNSDPVRTSKECEQATFSDLEYGFYVAKLTVTTQAVSAIDFVNIYAAGPPPGAGTEAKTSENAELNLWNFELKKFKYCKWSTARMLGTFDLPDNFEFTRGDDLVGKVTVEINRGGEPVVVMSDDLKLTVKKRRYRLEVRGHRR